MQLKEALLAYSTSTHANVNQASVLDDNLVIWQYNSTFLVKHWLSCQLKIIGIEKVTALVWKTADWGLRPPFLSFLRSHEGRKSFGFEATDVTEYIRDDFEGKKKAILSSDFPREPP